MNVTHTRYDVLGGTFKLFFISAIIIQGRYNTTIFNGENAFVQLIN